MLLTEWNTDDALAVRYKEGIGIGIEIVAKNALAKGMPLEQVQDLTDLDIETLQKLSMDSQITPS